MAKRRTVSPLEARGALRARQSLDELAEIIERSLAGRTVSNPFGPLWMSRSTTTTAPMHTVYRPSLCIVAQGKKLVTLGTKRYVYDPQHFLLSSIDLPVVGQVVEASPARPYLGMQIVLDPAVVGSVLVEMRPQLPPARQDVHALQVNPIRPCLLETVLRLARLVDVPEDIPVIAPLVLREIVYRLLTSDQGGRLQHIALLGGQIHRVAKIVERLRGEFAKPLRIDELARSVGMSVSGLHHHFKTVTAMSPIQFQRQVRLQEARRLMVSEDLDAAAAGFQVGYDDASHFSREYKRLFGAPPMRDVERLRGMLD